MPQKLLIGDKDTVLLIPAFELAGVPQFTLPSTQAAIPITAPTVALLNYWINIRTPATSGSSWGGNVTCAIIDDMNLAMTDSDTDDTRTLCSVGQSQDLTYYNYDAEMNFLRDVNPADTASEFNLPLQLVNAPDLAYIIAHRVGYSRTDAAATGQEWHFYYVWTDHAVPAFGDGDNQGFGETFIPKGIINFKYVLAS